MSHHNRKTCDCDERGIACQHAKTATPNKKLRAIMAQKRVEQAKSPPRKGKPTMFCDICNHAREAQYVKVEKAWPRTKYTCIVCKDAKRKKARKRK